jgi:N-acyl homoserine lactone hydrolase
MALPRSRRGYHSGARCGVLLAVRSSAICQYRDMADVTVRRVDFGYFVRPPEETKTGQPRVDPCLGYLVEHPRGVLLFDTGMGSHPEVDAWYRPHRTGLREALAAVGAQAADLSVAANCHLHFDHCGGNPLLGPVPVFVQAAELDAARRTEHYTLPELLEGSRFEEMTGEVEVLPDVFLMPTPGHTNGHQSLIVRRADGAVILAGQSHDTATQYAADQLAWQAYRDGHGQPLPDIPDWVDVLQRFDPRVVYFAHDRSVWIP